MPTSPPPCDYPLAQFPETTLSHSIVVRATGNLEQTIAAVKSDVWAVDPHQPIASVRTMDDIAAASNAQRRFNVVVVGFFALGGVLLSALGIYGVVAFAVAERMHEFGVRMALGARSSDLVRLVVAHAARLVATGLAVGLGAAIAVARLLETLLYGVGPTDVLTFISVSAAIAFVAAVACAAPVRRAMRIDPIVAIRIE